MLIRLLLIALLVPAAAPDDLETRAQALRAELAKTEQSEPQSTRVTMQRQLLTSLERRRDLERASADLEATVDKPAKPAPPPQSLLETDDLRREVQQLDVSIDAGVRRLAILHTDRDAAAAWLVQKLADVRQLEESVTPDTERLALARLETDFAESSTAELDAVIKVVELQQQAEHAERDTLARRLTAGAVQAKPTAADLAEIERRISARSTELQERLATAAKARDAAHAELLQQPETASAEHLKTLQERLNTCDIDIELVREATSNLNIEQAAWQIGIRYWRDGDPSALVEARARGPVVHDSLERRLDFMNVSSDQILTRIGALNSQIAQAPTAADAQEWTAQRATLDERLRMLESGALDKRRVLAVIDRVRGDFDERVGAASWKDRMSYAWASARELASRIWNLELFVVEQTVEVNGRQTKVPRGVTVEKVVKAPLLLLIGLFLAAKLTALIERRAVRRGTEPASARLARRWTLGLLAAACALASLAIAGIPFAAFAFIGGAVAIGVGFGMQTLFKNLISGVLVLIERPFRLGDEIQIGDLRGTVVDIDLRASVLRDGDGSDTLIPNSALVEQNVTARPREVRQSLSVTVDADSDTRKVADAMRGAAERHGLVDASREPLVLLDEFPGSGLRFSMQYWLTASPGIDRQRVASDLRLMILGAFNENGIKLAQGAMDLRVHADDARRIVDVAPAEN